MTIFLGTGLPGALSRQELSTDAHSKPAFGLWVTGVHIPIHPKQHISFAFFFWEGFFENSKFSPVGILFLKNSTLFWVNWTFIGVCPTPIPTLDDTPQCTKEFWSLFSSFPQTVVRLNIPLVRLQNVPSFES